MPSSGTAGRLLPVKVTKAPTLSVEGPRSVPSRILVVLVDGTTPVDTPGRECPREDECWPPRAGETRPAGVSVGGGDAGRPRVGETLLPEGNIAWMERYLPGLYPPCVVDRLPNNLTEIKAFDRFSMIHVDRNNGGPRCACVRGVPREGFRPG